MSVGWISLPICDGLYMLIGIPCKNFEMNASNLDQFVPGLNWIYPPNQVFGWCSSPGIQSYGFGSYISWGPVVYRKGTQRHFYLFKPGNSSFTLKVRCCYSPISGLVWWSGVLCTWSIWVVTSGLWEIVWKPFSWTLLFGEILKMDVRMMIVS